jgi:phospholipase/carboxylesterase
MKDTTPLRLGVPVAKAQVICVFVHGRSQSPEAMQESVIRHLATPGVAYVLPRAAVGSWYGARAMDALTDETRTALAGALAALGGVIEAVRAEAPSVPVLLAGFSQGACLSLEYAFAQGAWHGALAAFTGCRVGSVGDDRPAAALTGLPVYLTGADADPWIPVSAFAEATSALGHARARLRADLFPGRGHEVSAAEISILDAMLADLAAGMPATLERAR